MFSTNCACKQVDDPRGYIKLSRVERFIRSVGEFEEKIFKKRMEIRYKRIRRILSESRDDVSSLNDSNFDPLYI